MPSNREPPPLVVRADADERIGAGHVMRCLALAEAWRARGGCALFLTRCPDPALRRRIEAAGWICREIAGTHPQRADLRATLATLKAVSGARPGTPWLVLDGYRFNEDYHRTVKASGCRLLVIDDSARFSYGHADIVLNPGLQAEKLSYPAAPNSLLLGPRYALMRAEFRRPRARVKVAPVARKILVTLGGGDAPNVTLKVLQALAASGNAGFQARVIAGPLNRHFDELKRMAAAAPLAIDVESNVQSMRSRMLWADLAVTAAGGTAWELACLGVPMVALALADNQRRIAAALEAHGLAVNLGWHKKVTAEAIRAVLAALAGNFERRVSMSARGRGLIDGQGAERVAGAMLQRSCSIAA